MCKSRIIVSAHVEGMEPNQRAARHRGLLEHFVGTRATLRHAIGHFEGKEELSVVADYSEESPHPWMALAQTALGLCSKFGQQSVYFSKDGKAFLMSKDGELTVLGNEREGGGDAWVRAPADDQYNRTCIIGEDVYIWTENEK